MSPPSDSKSPLRITRSEGSWFNEIILPEGREEREDASAFPLQVQNNESCLQPESQNRRKRDAVEILPGSVLEFLTALEPIRPVNVQVQIAEREVHAGS